MVEKDLVALEETEKHWNVKRNLTFNNNKAIDSICANHDIVVKTADKGGSVVVLNATLYKNFNMDILQDTAMYKSLHNDPTDLKA